MTAPLLTEQPLPRRRDRAVASPYVVVCALCCLTATAFAQRNLKDIPPPDPELERKSFVLPEGFEVHLFAADPAIAKPIQMNFDPQGRLWVASSSVYPHIKPGQTADDKVLVLEDTDGDGRSDHTTVFARGLLIPTGVEPGDGGAYVANSTELLHLKDTDGDGRADQTRVVLSGFGTEDTHHILHTLRWGPAGMLYMNQSIYIHSHIETPYGVRRLNGGGVWQFRPESMRLNVYARGWINPWGHHFDDYGQSFVTDGAGGEGINYVLPGAAYPTAVGVRRILHGLNPGSPKYCGLEIVSGRHLPEDWQGDLLTNDFRGHRVCRFKVVEDGSGFASKQQVDLIRSSHVAFRPVDIKMGPDGAIYIADWYNPIIQHGEVDFRDPRRDHVHGRIWRVTYAGRKLVERPRLVDAPTAKLLDHLQAPEAWTRHQAKRVLKERGRHVLSELDGWVTQLDPDAPHLERHRLEALWLSQSLDEVRPELLEQLLTARDHRVRAAATRVLGHWQFRIDDPLVLLKRQVEDDHPRVRLEAVRVLGQLETGSNDPRPVKIALRALDRPVDGFLDYALWLTVREQQDSWLPHLQAGRFNFGGRVRHLTFALKAVGDPNVVAPLMKLIESGKVPTDQQAEVLQTVASIGGPRELRFLLDRALEDSTEPQQRAALLLALAKAAGSRRVVPAGDLEPVRRLLDSKNQTVRRLAVRCIGLWKVTSLADAVVKLANDRQSTSALQAVAIEALGSLNSKPSHAALLRLAEGDWPHQVRVRAIATLAAADPVGASGPAVRLLTNLPASADPTPVFNAFLQRKQGAAKLAAALSGQELSPDVAKIGLRAIDASGRKQPPLSAALTTAGRITSGPKSLSQQELTSLVAEVTEQGDAARGEAVFRRADLACLKCHAIGGAGGKVGPDLISLGASAQVDYLIESLLDPNKKVKENYHTLVVVTDEGKVVTGIKVRTTDTELILRDAQDRETAVPLKSIEEQVPGASIMPAGLTEKLTRSELVDLVRFLSELGKVGPFAVGKEPVVRRWRVMEPTSEAAYRLRRTSYDTAATDDPAYTWRPAYSTVAGALPLNDVPEVRVRNRVAAGMRGVGFARCEVEVTTPGRVRLSLNSPDGLTLWVDQRPVDVESVTEFDLGRGTHRLTFAIDLSQRTMPLRAEATEAAGSPARVQIVSGK